MSNFINQHLPLQIFEMLTDFRNDLLRAGIFESLNSVFADIRWVPEDGTRISKLRGLNRVRETVVIANNDYERLPMSIVRAIDKYWAMKIKIDGKNWYGLRVTFNDSEFKLDYNFDMRCANDKMFFAD